MLLCDSVTEAASRWSDADWQGPFVAGLSPAAWGAKDDQYCFLAARLREAVRFVLDDRVMANACAAIGARPTTLESCIKVLRVPHRLVWIEWNDRVRVAVRDALGWIGEPNGLPTPQRMGVLIEADGSGRRGFVAFAWQHPEREMPPEIRFKSLAAPDVCPLAVQFDFDDPTISDGCKDIDEADVAQFERRWYGDPREAAASRRVDRLARPIVPVWCSRYVNAFGALHARQAGLTLDQGCQQLITRAMGDLAGEFKQVISMLLMLTARNSVDLHDLDYGKLNAKRVKQGRLALLEHSVVKMRISGLERRRGATAGSPSGRASPQAHLVMGHYCVRKVPTEVVYYRRGHQRGSGVLPVKTVHVVP